MTMTRLEKGRQEGGKPSQNDPMAWATAAIKEIRPEWGGDRAEYNERWFPKGTGESKSSGWGAGPFARGGPAASIRDELAAKVIPQILSEWGWSQTGYNELIHRTREVMEGRQKKKKKQKSRFAAAKALNLLEKASEPVNLLEEAAKKEEEQKKTAPDDDARYEQARGESEAAWQGGGGDIGGGGYAFDRPTISGETVTPYFDDQTKSKKPFTPFQNLVKDTDLKKISPHLARLMAAAAGWATSDDTVRSGGGSPRGERTESAELEWRDALRRQEKREEEDRRRGEERRSAADRRRHERSIRRAMRTRKSMSDYPEYNKIQNFWSEKTDEYHRRPPVKNETIVKSLDLFKAEDTQSIQELISNNEEAVNALNVLARHGSPYIVGGGVRDALLGLPSKDIDIEVHGIELADLTQIIQRELGGSEKQVGKQFGVFKVGDLDISVPRKETKTGDKHTDFDIIPDPSLPVEDAARRRDFTINALMYDFKNDKILDFFGGLDDINDGIIRHVDPETFVEDPLRVYRAAQFAARFGFDVHHTTQKLAQTMHLGSLPKERVFEEFSKLLLRSSTPSIGLQALDDMGVLEKEFPEIAALKGTKQRDDYHAEGDVFTHTKMVLDKAAAIKEDFSDEKDQHIIMFSALLHDIGKPSTVDDIGGAHGHESAGVPIAESILNKLTDDKKIVNTVLPIVEHHLKPAQYPRQEVSDKAYRRLINTHGADFLHLLSAVSQADVTGRKHRLEDGSIIDPVHDNTFSERVKQVSEASGITPTQGGKLTPLVSGTDLKNLGFQEGRELGDILRDVQGQQVEGDLTHTEGALQYVRDKYKPTGGNPSNLEQLVKFMNISKDHAPVPPRQGLVWDAVKHKWVRPENHGHSVSEVQGHKRIRGHGTGVHERKVGGHGRGPIRRQQEGRRFRGVADSGTSRPHEAPHPAQRYLSAKGAGSPKLQRRKRLKRFK